jgi:hypothetical protein
VKRHFSIRIENEILSKIDRIALEEDRTRGAVFRRIVQHFFSKEESHECENHCENDRLGNDAGTCGGLQPDHPSGPRTLKEEKTMEKEFEQYAELLLAVLPREGRKELLYVLVDPHEPTPEIPAALAADMVGTPLETILGNHFLFGSVIGLALTRIWREEGRL